jgi:hypothetical protein
MTSSDELNLLVESVDKGKDVNVGTRLSVLWDDGYYYVGVVTKMRPENEDFCYVEYYDGDKAWHDLRTEQFSIVYAVGTKVYKKFPRHGKYWGEITVSKHDQAAGLYYEVEYSDGDLEKITNEPDSAQLLKELHAAILAARQKRAKHKRKREGSFSVSGSRKSKKRA